MTCIGARNRALDALHAQAVSLVRVLETNEDFPNDVVIDAAIAEINSAWWRAHPLVLAAHGHRVVVQDCECRLNPDAGIRLFSTAQ